MIDAMELLLACLKQEPAEEKVDRLKCFGREEWAAVRGAALRHGVEPLLFYTLKPLCPVLNIPEPVWSSLQRAYYSTAARNMRLYRELAGVVATFNRQGIAAILLKGAHLAEHVYENIALRGMGDADLLVKKEDLLRADRELLRLGAEPGERVRVYSRHSHHFGYRLRPSGLMVEIHWALITSLYPCRVDEGGLWRRARPVKLGPEQAWVLSPEDLLLHLCLHAAKHINEITLRDLFDLGAVLRRYEAALDWRELAARARQWGILRAVYVLLSLTRDLLGSPVAADTLEALRPAGFDNRYLDLVRRQLMAASLDRGGVKTTLPAARLWMYKGPGGKLKHIRDRLLLSREEIALMYTRPADRWRVYLFYYPLRLAGLLQRHGAVLWRLLRGDAQSRAAAARTHEITSLGDWLLSG
ncbi:MAG TPA: nucleotidyltransferase family protein [Bacillota bacterium]|nr:nucleotidyltransferase family protein [Bacillota bacterium]